MSKTLLTGAALAVAIAVTSAPAEARDPYPHEFHNNMGYCAPFLAQQRLPDGTAVRPWINNLIQQLTRGDATFEGQENLGDLYSDRARSETDTNCLARSGQ